jgi:protein-disulfide isomerase
MLVAAGTAQSQNQKKAEPTKSAQPAAAAPSKEAPKSAQKSALTKSELDAYVRHLWLIPASMELTIGDPKPSELTGFQEVTVKLTQGAATQELPLYISKDGAKIVQGNVYDINLNPFKKDLDKLKTQGQPSLGTPGATVVLVEFSDLECPHCKQEAQMLRQNLISAFPTQVRFYFIDFPLEALHPWAKAAAIGGRCVFRQDPGSFWEYHDWIFSHQETITAENLKEIVQIWARDRKDIDGIQLGRCVDQKETEKEVNAELAEGQSLNIEGTPTLFVNGRRVGNAIAWPDLKSMIESEIEYQKVAKNAGEDCGCDVKLDVPGLKVGGPQIKKN